ncbi:SMP-30/gluconolactonase/LRE family protein [Actibacterium sp. 188UL27-1]|uniref:SMP-30/gluconolactonase/LRE family protein n=1 Tax=Actibacterium sp. 188UL27-1 TaxID=2786961 RepID=UPI00195D3B8E|nr:SMP-30/gluconolactonase/LRE family protein [Actibacterium sp. 188UL27-1]MBM7069770.1 SMP-30/gluconolactonase/LRE family protein [Actibacterium sp. 188UL27-1]
MAFFEVVDPAFGGFVMGNAPVKQLATGFDWTEGPVWFGDANCLLFSDIPNNRIMRWTPGAGISTYRAPSNYANGHTRDREGRLISCEHGMRRVTRTELDGSITVIADSFDGKRLNSPNDVVVKSDGSIWFTDPHYGIMTNYEGFQSEQELPCNMYRVGPDGQMTVVVDDANCPNGLAFSPDESRLYVVDTGRMFTDDPQHIRVFDVQVDHLTGGDVFHIINPGCADGIRVDTDGNLWSSAADGVHCIAPDGHLMGKILVPELVSNICFGGRAKHQLFITATTSVYSVILNREGVQQP